MDQVVFSSWTRTVWLDYYDMGELPSLPCTWFEFAFAPRQKEKN